MIDAGLANSATSESLLKSFKCSKCYVQNNVWRDRDNNLMWKSVIGGYPRVPGQSNWYLKMSWRPAMWFVERSIAPSMLVLSMLYSKYNADHVTSPPVSRDQRPAVRTSKLPLSEQGKCHHHGWWSGDAQLYLLKSFNSHSNFNSLLLQRSAPKDGRKKVFLLILLGLDSWNCWNDSKEHCSRFSNPVREAAGMKAPLPDKTDQMWVCFHDAIISFPSNKNWPGMTWNLTSWKLKSMAGMFGAVVDLQELLNHFVMAPVRWFLT